ncbi:heavy-metal-associated domain-containing protein [Tenacibaculum sp. MEBiC06402]|uniref:heavy-metal-associated domain-containing protein n=1 Tax=unclassified Tenacibaculum TaxID=2635139 RepID=UPI003B997EBC
MKKIITIICLVLIGFTGQAQKKRKNAKLTFEVDGVCMMCKKRIEKAALNTKGVKFANWDVNNHQLMVIIDERKTDKKKVCESMAKAGHDTKEIKATDEAYDKLHACCKYRDEEIKEQHQEKQQ